MNAYIMNYNDPIGSFLGPWASELSVGSIILRIALSILLGAVIGWERSSKRHAAGLRTFILTSFASTLAMVLDLALQDHYLLLSAAAVIGIAIISINSVLYNSRSQIRGLTTSVGLWMSGILGLLVGAGFYTISLAAFLAMLLSLSFFPQIEKYLKDRSNHFEILVEMTNPAGLSDFVMIIRELGMQIDEIELNTAYAGSGLSVYMIAVSIDSDELRKYKTHKEIIEALKTVDYIRHIEEIS